MKHAALSPIEEVNLFLEPGTNMADFQSRLKESICQLSILRTIAKGNIDDQPISDAVDLMAELCFEFDMLERDVDIYLRCQEK